MVNKEAYLSLASLLEGNTRNPFARKKNPHCEALREAGELYGRLEYIAAYKCVKPAHEKVVGDMQRIVARNVDFEANKLVKEQKKPLAAAKETVQKLKAHAKQVIEQFDILIQDLESKPLVKSFLAKGESEATGSPSLIEEYPPLQGDRPIEISSGTSDTPATLDVSGDRRYRKVPYTNPQKGSLYAVRDKSKGERIIRVVEVSSSGNQVKVEIVEEGRATRQPIEIAVASLIRQSEKGWCNSLLPIAEGEEDQVPASFSTESKPLADIALRLDSQNFGRCCADIVRANIKFDTQLIKDIGDGPFRAGNYEQAFSLIEQCGIAFSSAAASSRREIANGRRALHAEKVNLSGKEIQDRTAAFVRSEHLIHTAEREFSTILEGLRMYLRAMQDNTRHTSIARESEQIATSYSASEHEGPAAGHPR